VGPYFKDVKMKYVIVYLIEGEVEKFHQRLVRTVGPKFGEKHLVENPRPSHVTLNSPFQFDNLKELEKIIRLFANKNNSSVLEIDGFGNFRRFVAFLNTKFSEKGIKIQKKLIRELKSLGLEPHEFDKKWKPHATIAYGNTKKNFDNIWNYLKKLDKSKFKIRFDNITILKKPRKYWKVHKIYRLKA